MKGFAGKILRVDLTRRTTSEQVLDEATARAYLGGRGIAAKLLFEELAPGIDPLGPENKLIFATGPAAGTVIPGSTRVMVAAKSPATGLYGEAAASGSFGPELKKAGYDVLVVEGRAEAPVYLWIKDGKVEIRDAAAIWGKPVAETDDAVKAAVQDPKAWVMAIGPAGERLIKFASIMSDKHRAAARCGLGAVMGSKNLKAIAVRGTGRVPVADLAALRELSRTMVAERATEPAAQRRATVGTSGAIPSLQQQGTLPTKNFQRGTFEGSDAISGQRLAETIQTGTTHCAGCMIPHDRIVDLKESPYGPISGKYGAAEYETVAAFGSMCLVDDLVAINAANQRCNAYGMDTISTGTIIAWVLECYEMGLLNKKDLGGIEARWGDPKAMLALVELIGKREGIGDLLAEGVKAASEKVGKGSGDFAIQVRGMELGMHEPRGKKGLALVYTAICPAGPRHMEAAHDPAFERPNALPEIGIVQPIGRLVIPGKADIMRKAADLHTAVSAIGECAFVFEPAFVTGTITQALQMLKGITGWDVSADELMTIGERANNVARAFIVREGSDRRDDVLPKRFQEAIPEGATAGLSISQAEMDQMLDEFYVSAGWTQKGVPTKAKLKELGLQQVAEDLESRDIALAD